MYRVTLAVHLPLTTTELRTRLVLSASVLALVAKLATQLASPVFPATPNGSLITLA